MIRLLITAILVTGCVGIAPTPSGAPIPVTQATPVVVYITPAPVTVTPQPVPTVRPVQPPPVATGTSWLDYLTWGLETTQAWSDLFNSPMNTTAQIKSVGERGVDLATSDSAWLRTHDPLPCYEDLYNQHIVVTAARLAAMQAAANFDFDAVELVQEATNEGGIYVDMLDQDWC